MRILLVRHGQSESNRPSADGFYPDGGLTALGRAQSERLAEWLSREPPRALYASTLQRARETAQIVSQACAIPIVFDRRLREVGTCWPGGEPVQVEQLPKQWPAGAPSTRPTEPAWGNSETWMQFQTRVQSFAQEMKALPSNHHVVAVTHSGFIDAFCDLAFGAGIVRGVEIASGYSSITDWEHRPAGPEPWLLHGINLRYHLLGREEGSFALLDP
jgi:broad specificity phosphatase PhoE